MKKKITCLVMCLLVFCMTVFTGCSLVEVDSDKYYNSVVVEIKDESGKVVSKITNRELLSGYQSVGYSYEYYGYTKEEAINMTLKLLENRKIVLMQAEKIWGVDQTGKNLSDTEKTYLWEQTVSALQTNLNSYLDTEESKEEETETTIITYDAYSPKAELEVDKDGNFSIKLIDQKDGVLDNYTPSVSKKDYYGNEEDKNLIYENFFENNKFGKNFDAYKQYLNDLKYSEKGQNLSTDPMKVFEREIDRLYTQSYENYIIEKYTEQLLETNGVSNVEVQDILDLYSSKVRASYTQFALEKDEEYDNTMQESSNDVYYYCEGQENNTYFSVLNILFNKNEKEEGKFDLIIREKDENGNYEQTSTEVVSKNEIYSFVESNIANILTNAQNSSDDEILYDAMTECVFKYNQDPGMQTSDAKYVIGIDAQGNPVSNFVESFNTAGKALYNQNVIGNIEIAESEFGIHVLVYTGKFENLFKDANETFALKAEQAQEGELSAIQLLDSTRVSPMLDKTYFDLLFDELYQDNSSSVQQADVDVLRANYEMVYYKGRIPDSLKG
ncbi:MAG: hypothetical protein E7379_01090 [Clostridiales bacterium]|nr:hypothetical protein [Clostridiales bacterium]